MTPLDVFCYVFAGGMAALIGCLCCVSVFDYRDAEEFENLQNEYNQLEEKNARDVDDYNDLVHELEKTRHDHDELRDKIVSIRTQYAELDKKYGESQALLEERTNEYMAAILHAKDTILKRLDSHKELMGIVNAFENQNDTLATDCQTILRDYMNLSAERDKNLESYADLMIEYMNLKEKRKRKSRRIAKKTE